MADHRVDGGEGADGGSAARGASERPARHPKVTALVPTYNGAEFITRTLDCLASQTWPNLEILIGDDRSTDRTLDVVRAFAEGRDNVRVLERHENLGWLRNSNDLMANAAGEFMFFAFHDDVVDPTYVERLLAEMVDRPDVVMAFSDVEVAEVDGAAAVHTFDALTRLRSPFARGAVMVRRPDGWWVPNRGLFRASAFHRIGGIHPNDKGEYSADWTWLLHMALLGEFVRVPEVLCRKFYMKASLSKTWPHDAAQVAALRRAGIREIRLSPLGWAQKAPLIGYLWVYLHTPAKVKSLVRRVIPRR